MSASDPALEDPLIAALPPNTDYITYLTILEYQLTPKNLPTLNRLLQDDDGTLASEIGWDLLKLVLPILRVEPNPAKECLDIISRRGNPREVIVRVSEELETLGIDEVEEEADHTDSDDGLPTFAGEAPRVHLGNMTLAGMPPHTEKPEFQLSSEATDHEQQLTDEQEQHVPDAAVAELKLQSLLSMLSLLHPRIKTQYPSRFLATSLPAALGAYRRLSMNSDSTFCFLDTLTKLSGNARPALPPRIPTAELLNRTAASTSAPLPDPESKSDSEKKPSQATSESEASINKRLLQAVLLEIIEEFTAASSEAQPPLTAHLRAQYQPTTITSARRKDLDISTTSKEAQNADHLRRKFLAVARTLKLDVQAELLTLLQPAPEDMESQEEHEYPTSPSQIPFSITGLLLLYSALNFIQATSQSSSSHPISTASDERIAVLETINNQYKSDSRLRQSGPALDCILSVLYTIICADSQGSQDIQHPNPSYNFEHLFIKTFSLLQDIFTTCPDPDLRDNAYHISTHLLHGHLSPLARVTIIKELLGTSTSASTKSTSSPIHEAQIGNLKAIAINWLKDEIYPTQSTLQIMEHLTNPDDRGLQQTTLIDLADHIFSTNDTTSSSTTTTTFIPIPPSKSNHPTTQTEDDPATANLESFATELPFYISALNLLTIVSKTHDRTTIDDEDTNKQPANDPKTLPVIVAKAEPFLAKLQAWNIYLTTQLAEITKAAAATDTDADAGRSVIEDVDGISISDIYALEDAVGRATEALQDRRSV